MVFIVIDGDGKNKMTVGEAKDAMAQAERRMVEHTGMRERRRLRVLRAQRKLRQARAVGDLTLIETLEYIIATELRGEIRHKAWLHERHPSLFRKAG